ncbi:hypothetical protein NM688_g8032 [Phlebia brevispora]|uniref:Uncharacterized protein n=1 Tax=Phlebia brevispora TaxID=194682 RepID=A0ACC1RYA4_9APHY|nr:hypothetical protein NM688_g8032 [Phlebia brevispora]
MWREGECAAGKFVGEVEVEDIMEAVLEQRGVTGAWIREVLEEEGYWGYSCLLLCTDWTLHSSPTPAHPSYRLITALRLYVVFSQRAHDQTFDGEGGLDEWRRVIAGEREIISPENENEWRALLLRLCSEMAQRARAGMKQAEGSLPVSGEPPAWLEWMLKNIRLLWLEELEVAEAVAQSIESNEEF